MVARVVVLVLLVLLAVIHNQLWLGSGSVARVHELSEQIAQQKAANAAIQHEVDRLHLEVNDLKEGQGMIEEKGRSELGMIRPGEIYVQIMP